MVDLMNPLMRAFASFTPEEQYAFKRAYAAPDMITEVLCSLDTRDRSKFTWCHAHNPTWMCNTVYRVRRAEKLDLMNPQHRMFSSFGAREQELFQVAAAAPGNIVEFYADDGNEWFLVTGIPRWAGSGIYRVRPLAAEHNWKRMTVLRYEYADGSRYAPDDVVAPNHVGVVPAAIWIKEWGK